MIVEYPGFQYQGQFAHCDSQLRLKCSVCSRYPACSDCLLQTCRRHTTPIVIGALDSLHWIWYRRCHATTSGVYSLFYVAITHSDSRFNTFASGASSIPISPRFLPRSSASSLLLLELPQGILLLKSPEGRLNSHLFLGPLTKAQLSGFVGSPLVTYLAIANTFIGVILFYGSSIIH